MDNAILNCNTATLQQICRMYFPKKKYKNNCESTCRIRELFVPLHCQSGTTEQRCQKCPAKQILLLGGRENTARPSSKSSTPPS